MTYIGYQTHFLCLSTNNAIYLICVRGKCEGQNYQELFGSGSSAQISLELVDPKICDMLQLECVIRGIKKCTGQLTCTRLPITPGLMKSLRKHWVANNTEQDSVMLWAAACMCFLVWFYEDWGNCSSVRL